MPSDDEARRRLIGLLDRKAFQPVLSAKAEDFPEAKRHELEQVQDATRSERERFGSYRDAGEVARMFHDDLSSAPAKKVHARLRELGLPTLNDIREEFERLEKELGVER